MIFLPMDDKSQGIYGYIDQLIYRRVYITMSDILGALSTNTYGGIEMLVPWQV